MSRNLSIQVASRKLAPPKASVSDDPDLFPEMATTLYCWVARLYRELEKKGVGQVFFLSREGQPLMRMFNLYRDRMGGSMVSRYLEVSRRSTLLPSLGALGDETFATLFRQYRRMSMFEFLSSLVLEAYCTELCDAIGVEESSARDRFDDFPTCDIFTRLKQSRSFQAIYEAERQARRDAFVRYLISLSAGHLPVELVIVDVGWKGTIQDNLYNLLCRSGNTAVASVRGYYVGLIAEGSANPRNIKEGLLFSSIGGKSPYFCVFNENRALFEVMLAADHGSAASYALNDDGAATPVRGSFEEANMLETMVLPEQRRIFGLFEGILEANAPPGTRDLSSMLKDAARAHARMVFQPTRKEREWFSTLYHVENFGVFEQSRFASPEQSPSLSDRLSFLLSLVGTKGRPNLGFWPWKTIHDSAGAFFAHFYAIYRRALH